MRRLGRHPILDDDDPLSGMVNLFDIAIVFAVGLIVALVVALRGGHVDRVLQASAPEIDVRKGKRIVRYRATRESAQGEGRRLGTAYRLPGGEVVYVPDEAEAELP